MLNIIVINPGSTSTKLSLFSIPEDSLSLSSSFELEEMRKVHLDIGGEKREYHEDIKERRKTIEEFIKKNESIIEKVIAVAGRGGLLRPLKGGVYRVNECMIEDLVSCKYGRHASNMGAPLAYEIARLYDVDAFIAYPVVVDEMDAIARYTGIPEVRRKSIFHALNQKSVARAVANQMGRDYKDLNMIVTHLGGGISVGLHVGGRVVDVNNALDGDGPFSIERAGSVPSADLMKLCFSGRHTYDELYAELVGKGGIFAHLGTKDARFLEDILLDKPIQNGEKSTIPKEKVKEVIDACIYQVAKQICALACYTCGKLDAVVLTGGLARFRYFVEEIKRRVSFLSRVYIFPGEDEMRALAEGVVLALQGREKIYEYGSEE